MKYIFKLFLLIQLSLLVSCTVDEECRISKNVNFVSKFYKVSYVASTNSFNFAALSIDSITVKGLKIDSATNNLTAVDSILYNNTKKINSITLALDKFSSQSKFTIKFNQVTDTVTIYHSNSDYYLSLECGCIKTFTIDTVLTTNNFIDSVKITNHKINNTNAEHLYIYN